MQMLQYAVQSIAHNSSISNRQNRKLYTRESKNGNEEESNTKIINSKL